MSDRTRPPTSVPASALPRPTGGITRPAPTPRARVGQAGEPARPTIDDVARAAGVSTATVTRALQGHPHVRAATRARVEAAVGSLGYVPHLGARALATRSSQTIGLLVPSSADGFWGEVAEGLEERAAQAGFSTLLATSRGDADRERALIRLFLGKRVDGIVVGSAAGSAWLADAGGSRPLVFVDWQAPLGEDLLESARTGPVEQVLAAIDRRLPGASFTDVRTDDLAAAADAARHLLALGHRTIAYAGLRPVRASLLRLLGVRVALAEAGLRPTAVIDAPASLDGGRSAGADLLRDAAGTSAVVAFDDMIAVGIMRAVHAAGLLVPRDLSVVGFDDVAVAAFVEPPLTTVRQHKSELGATAVEVILAALAGAPGPARTVLPGTLIVRDSTAAPAS
jgi:LacI family transcriptional regulator, galactose operon repressor